MPSTMDASASGAGGGGGGPAPFLLKTYDMIDDSATDEIVSWSAGKNSFVVWNQPEFARVLLPTYFKHNNFSSFIRQLNTYGFRKIDPERWEFANEGFVKDQKHLLKNIHRRKPIHSHSNPPGSVVDPERAAFEEEIERLSHDKASLEAKVLSYRQQQSGEKLELEDMMQRVGGVEQRQEKLLTFLQKAVKDPSFVEHLARKVESMDFSAYKKKRRLPQVEPAQPVAENSFVEEQSTSRPEFGNIFHQDFSSKLRLELSPAVSDINVVSYSTQSSNEDFGSPQIKLSEGGPKQAQMRKESTLYSPELSDTGTSFTFRVDPSSSGRKPTNHPPQLNQGLSFNEEGDGHLSCQLNLTLASSSLQVNRSPYSSSGPQIVSRSTEPKLSHDSREPGLGVLAKNRVPANEQATLSSSQEAPDNNHGSAAPTPPVRANDGFWEQFLTERPGSSDNEEASSSYRANPCEEQEDKRSGYGISRSTRNMEQLTL